MNRPAAALFVLLCGGCWFDPQTEAGPEASLAAILVAATAEYVSFALVSGAATEQGDSATAELMLIQAPAGLVRLGLSSDRPTEVSVSPSIVEFDAVCPGTKCWSSPQNITLTGGGIDAVADGPQQALVTASILSSEDPAFRPNTVRQLTISNADIFPPAMHTGWLVQSLTNLNLAGQGAVAVVSPGSNVSISFDYVIGHGGCPGCVVVGAVGLYPANPGTQYCFVDAIVGATQPGSSVSSLTAPATPGIYYVRTVLSWDFCTNAINWTLPVASSTIGILVVQ